MTGKLILVRHGQSTWNVENLFTGWQDVDLSALGREEAVQAGLPTKIYGEYVENTSFANAPGLEGWDNGVLEFSLPGGYRGLGHDGATLSFFSKMVLVPDLNLGIFIAANTESGDAFVQRFPGELVGRFYAPPIDLPRPGSPTSQPWMMPASAPCSAAPPSSASAVTASCVTC